MDILMDDVTSETLAELEKTQKDFWNIPRKTGVLLNDGGKKCTGDWNLKRVFRIMACKGLERNGREINYY